ncbi:MAG TPA: hypothetical protein VMF61_07590 [Candidatus Acidoferrales bacterium]|nr:hypothetical protein [Candidatus Acidoferrales bacterium]
MRPAAAAIGLRIPDNAAYTALVTLRRLGIAVERLERNEIWVFDDDGDPATLASRVEANETVFNPNKHRLALLESTAPRAGEAWIGELDAHDEVREHLGGKGIEGIRRARRYVAWRLFDRHGSPAARETVAAAVNRLLCNPAIEEAIF